jgi:PPOX class probable F420-dependent enzyme
MRACVREGGSVILGQTLERVEERSNGFRHRVLCCFTAREKEEGPMAMALPQSVRKILEDKAYGHVVTFYPNGNPQISMVWMDVEGDEVLFNTAEGRVKPQNLRRNPRVIVSVQDRNDPQSSMVIYGNAAVTEAGADAQIDKLAKRFLDAEKYPFRRPGEKRLIVRIKVDRIGGYGPKMQPWT